MISGQDVAMVRNFLRYKNRIIPVAAYARCSVAEVKTCTDTRTAKDELFLRVVDACRIVLFLEQK